MKTHFRSILFLIAPFMLIIESYGQSPIDHTQKISPELLKKDFTLLKDSLQNLHPGLFRYKSEKEMNTVFDNCYNQLDHSMTEIDFFTIVSGMISNIGDGHTECFLPQDLIKDVITNVKIFPIQLRFIGDKAYVPCDTKEFLSGTEIIAIDDKPINNVRQTLFKLLSSDGSIETEKYIKINDGHDPFSYLYYVVYGEKADFKVSYKTLSGQSLVKTLQADYFNNMACPPVKIKINQYLHTEYKPDGVAIMTIKTFASDLMERTKENFTVFLDTSFTELKNKKIEKLIIDLRDNGGGDDTNGALLYSYLTAKPFLYYTSLNSNKREVKDHPNLTTQQPKEINFKGKVEFLISGKSFSGAAEFSSIAKSNSRGLFIGEETGGGYYGNTSGSKITLILPNSKIRVNIPLYKYVMAVKKTQYKDRGIIPDYTIVPTIQDFIQHKDVQMELAVKLVNEKK